MDRDLSIPLVKPAAALDYWASSLSETQMNGPAGLITNAVCPWARAILMTSSVLTDRAASAGL